MSRVNTIWLLAPLLAALALSGCPSAKKQAVTDQKGTGVSVEPDKVLYEKANEDLKRNRYDEARLALQTLINTYPDSEYLAKAKLGMADSFFKQGGAGELTQAIAQYQDFITFFPFLDEAAYAQMQIGMAHYRRMEKPDRDRDGDAQDGANPNLHAFAGKLHGAQNQDEFGALAHHHEENERGQANARGELGFRRVFFDALFDFRFQMPRHAVHPDDHRDHKNGRDEEEHTLESVFADLPALQRDGNGKTGSDRSENASPHPARQIRSPGAVQIDKDDADDQSGFDTFAKSDEKC